MRHAFRRYSTSGVAIVGTSLIVVIPMAPPAADVHVRAVRLASSDSANSPLGDGTALIVGATSFPTPNQAYIDFADSVYLDPRGFTGTSQALTTPESLYPLTGPFTETFDDSLIQGEQNVVNAVQSQIAGGGVSAANPVVLLGYSQGAQVVQSVQPQLAAAGVPSADVHMVIVGDSAAPDGGLLERFDLPNGVDVHVPSLGLTFTSAPPSDLYPTDVYTYEYDGFADFPRYPIDVVSDLNAYIGVGTQHLAYFGVAPQQLAGAIQLPVSSADTMTNYYMIPAESLPLVDPLRLIPFVGNPLADLLQPDLRVLVDLGYGSITQGWDPGYADVQTPVGFLPPADVLAQAPGALVNGAWQGVNAAVADLVSPSNYTNWPPTWFDQLLASAPAEIGDQSLQFQLAFPDLGTFPIHTGVPLIDMAEAVAFTLPAYDLGIAQSAFAAGNLLDAIGTPVAADIGLLPLILIGSI